MGIPKFHSKTTCIIKCQRMYPKNQRILSLNVIVHERRDQIYQLKKKLNDQLKLCFFFVENDAVNVGFSFWPLLHKFPHVWCSMYLLIGL